MTNLNARQITEWNGGAGESWRTNAERFDRMLRPFSDALLAAARIQYDEKVLEVGCGAGGLAIEMAKLGAKVTAVDVSENLIDLALTRQSKAAVAVDFRLGDVSQMDFAPDFDLLLSHLGVMFFDAPVMAFANMRKALRPSGRLACLAWRNLSENQAASLPEKALAPDLAPPPPPIDAPGPFSFGDATRVQRILKEAGFTDIIMTPFDANLLFGEGEDHDAALEDALDMAYHIGPLRRWLADSSQSVKIAVQDRLRKLFFAHLTNKGVEVSGAAWIITAKSEFQIS